jgi:hypothetical protein
MSSELTLQIVPSRQRIEIPKSVGLCPYCDGEVGLVAECQGWSLESDGTWSAESIDLSCKNEPELDETSGPQQLDAWDEWLAAHSYMPYVFWLPLQLKVIEWINSKYRFSSEQ